MFKQDMLYSFYLPRDIYLPILFTYCSIKTTPKFSCTRQIFGYVHKLCGSGLKKKKKNTAGMVLLFSIMLAGMMP